MKYASFLWDFDGTLFDSYPHIAAAFEHTLTRHGIAYDHETVLERLYVFFTCAREEYGLSDAQYGEFLRQEADWGLRPAVAPFPHTAAVLRAICEAGGKNYLYTHRGASARAYLRLYGLDKYFAGGVDATMKFPPKPAPDAVEYITRAYGLEKEKTVMIGDREIDVLSGVNAGTAGCLFLSHPVREKETAAAYTAPDMLALARTLDIPLRESDLLTEEAAAQLRAQAAAAAEELCAAARLTAGQTVVVGCSSSEIAGERIGSASSPQTAEAVLAGLTDVFVPRGIHIAAQCCEHLNRALVVERTAAGQAEAVNVVPMPKAGGAFASAAWQTFADPVVVARIQADAGLDIGGTLIGMHLKRVAVPLRLTQKQIGQAALSAARVRPPFTGGERAVYSAELL